MITTDEVVSFPKVAKNVKPKYDKRTKNYTWKALADDDSVLRYGSREYAVNEQKTHKVITTYSETKYGERQDRGEQGQIRQEFNDRDFLRLASKDIIPNSKEKSQALQRQDNKKDLSWKSAVLKSKARKMR